MFSLLANIKQENQKLKKTMEQMDIYHKELGEYVRESTEIAKKRLSTNKTFFDEQSKRVAFRRKTAIIQNKEQQDECKSLLLGQYQMNQS